MSPILIAGNMEALSILTMKGCVPEKRNRIRKIEKTTAIVMQIFKTDGFNRPIMFILINNL